MFHEAFVFACNSALRAANSTNKLVAYFVHLCLRLARIFEGKSARSCTKKARERGVYHVLSRAVPLRYSLFDFLLQKFQGAFQSNNLHVVLYGIKSRRNSGVLFLLFFCLLAPRPFAPSHDDVMYEDVAKAWDRAECSG